MRSESYLHAHVSATQNFTPMKFQDQLAALGFESYEAYLSSAGWYVFRDFYRRSGRSQRCQVCSTGSRIELHHRTYVRLGREELDDVIPACRDCHRAIHDWLKSSGREFVEYTHEAVEYLREKRAKFLMRLGKPLTSVELQNQIAQDRKNAKRRAAKICQQIAGNKKAEEIREWKKRFIDLHLKLRTLKIEGRLKLKEFNSAISTRNRREIEKIIEKAARRPVGIFRNQEFDLPPMTKKDRKKAEKSLRLSQPAKFRPRAAAPFQPNATANHGKNRSLYDAVQSRSGA